MRLFIDESGSITTSKNPSNRYFLIGFLETENPFNVIRQFREAKKDYIKRTPNCSLDITKEIKGSEMPFGMKKIIFERIAQKSDAKFHFKIIDNFNLYATLASSPSLSFNYFIYLSVSKINGLTGSPIEKLFLNIDDRNTALESLNSLEDYLKIKFVIENHTFDDVRVKYHESNKKDLIQVIDLFCNTVYRLARFPETDKRNRILLETCNVGCSHYFPWKECQLDFCDKSS